MGIVWFYHKTNYLQSCCIVNKCIYLLYHYYLSSLQPLLVFIQSGSAGFILCCGTFALMVLAFASPLCFWNDPKGSADSMVQGLMLSESRDLHLRLCCAHLSLSSGLLCVCPAHALVLIPVHLHQRHWNSIQIFRLRDDLRVIYHPILLARDGYRMQSQKMAVKSALQCLFCAISFYKPFFNYFGVLGENLLLCMSQILICYYNF